MILPQTSGDVNTHTQRVDRYKSVCGRRPIEERENSHASVSDSKDGASKKGGASDRSMKKKKKKNNRNPFMMNRADSKLSLSAVFHHDQILTIN